MARLELMQRALMQGAAPAEAARYARTVALPLRERAAKIDAVLTDGTAAVAEAPAPLRIAPVEVAPPSPVVRRARGGGGATLRMPGADARARGLGRAALAMDSTAVQRLVEESIAADGLVATWDEVARPVLAAVGERWATTGRGVEVEHLLSQCLVAVFVRVAGFADAPAAPQPVRPVLLAAMPTELHVVPLAVLAALLAERGSAAARSEPPCPPTPSPRRCAGPRPPPSCSGRRLPSTADLGVVTGLPITRPRYRTFVAGPAGTARPCRRVSVCSARSSTRASASPAPCCGERRRRPDEPASRRAADAVVQRVPHGIPRGPHE